MITTGRDAENDPRRALALALTVGSLASATAAAFSVANYIPIVGIELCKLALAAPLIAPGTRRRSVVLFFTSAIGALSLVEVHAFFPFFFRPDALTATLLLFHLFQPLIVSALAALFAGVCAALPIALSGVHLAFIFERLQGEPSWLPTIPVLVGVLFTVMVYYMTRYRRERAITTTQLRQVETLNSELSTATAELIRYRQREMLAALAGSVTHEINNPANYAAGSLELLRKQLDTVRRGEEEGHVPDTTLAHIEELLDSACHGIRTITDVTRRLRGMFRGSAAAPVSVALRDVAHSVVSMLATAGGRGDVTVTVAIPEELAISAHPADMHVLVSNLIQNAITAASADGDVLLSASANEEAVRIVVEDDGPGIPADIEVTLFDPFVTGHREGSGIGLALCRTIVTKRGGTIRMERPDGGPTRFIVDLPRVVS